MFSELETHAGGAWTLESHSTDGTLHMRWKGHAVATQHAGVFAVSSPPGTPVEHPRRGIQYALDHWCVAVFCGDGYNVMADFGCDGRTLRTYVNLASAPTIVNSTIAWSDLWVDVIFTHGAVAVVDENELWEACRNGCVTTARANEVVALAKRIASSRSAVFHPASFTAYLEMLSRLRSVSL